MEEENKSGEDGKAEQVNHVQQINRVEQAQQKKPVSDYWQDRLDRNAWRKSKRTCYRCGLKGHYANECDKTKQDKIDTAELNRKYEEKEEEVAREAKERHFRNEENNIS